VHGVDPERGAVMAEALLLVSRRAWTREPTKASAENYGAAADLAATAWHRLGRHEKVVALARDVSPAILQSTNGYRSTSLATRGVDSLIELGRLDEARALLTEAKHYDDRYFAEQGQRDPNLSFTEDRLAHAVRSAVEPADNRSADVKATDGHAVSVRSIMAALTQLKTALPPQVLDQLAQEALADTKPSNAREVLNRSSEAYRTLGMMLGVSDELMRNQIEIQDAGRLLFDPEKGKDPTELGPMRERVRNAQAWFAASGHELDALDALWPIAVISRRLNDHEAALDAMRNIRETIEQRRMGISDPLQTAALFSRFPYLYENMVLSALELGRVGEALSAIEASKGRAIAELRSAREGSRAEGLSRQTLAAAAAASRIGEFTAALEVDYLSFFVGEDEIIAVLTMQHGDQHVERFAMPKVELRRLMGQVDPGKWSYLGATRVDQKLAPLVETLLSHITAPTLVISPDDPLHNLPFHYLQTSKGRLIDVVATVKVHGADDLRAAFDKPPTRPMRAKAVFLPAGDEKDTDARRDAFDRLCTDLPLPVEIIDGARFDRSVAERLVVQGELLHLAAHGYWPPPPRGTGEAPDYYGASGVLLSLGGTLPERGEPLEDSLLSPRLVIESTELDVRNAVVCIQACVSGLSAEGRAGDALGLEWALIGRGASTALASHWDVFFATAVAYFARFYKGWLSDGLSRAQASRAAMLALRDDPAFARYGLDWAAFTLIGEWR
ncbi:MAG TPA: CHAT domain-containing protein, partial [Hyphomonadaceae bacterium]|nr:CHAT domain-containing protein [Hyphomonadaceae bacterium]